MSTTIDELTALARAQIEAEQNVEEAKKSLAEAKEHLRQLSEEHIPSIMEELGVERMVLSTGQTVSVKQDVYASIPKAEQHKAFRWLEDHEFGGLIKSDVVLSFGREELDVARKMMEGFMAQGLKCNFKESIHAQTMKAFLREQIAAGTPPPLDLFGARQVYTTKISEK